MRRRLGLSPFRATGATERRVIALERARFEADLATWAEGDCRVTLQALDPKRMHVVLSLGPLQRLRFAGSVQR